MSFHTWFKRWFHYRWGVQGRWSGWWSVKAGSRSDQVYQVKSSVRAPCRVHSHDFSLCTGFYPPPLGQMSAGTAPWWQLSYMGMSLISVPPDWLLEKYPSVSFRNLTKIHLIGREIHGIKNDKYNCLCKQNCRSLQTLRTLEPRMLGGWPVNTNKHGGKSSHSPLLTSILQLVWYTQATSGKAKHRKR